MRFRILGPLEVTPADGARPLGAGKQRALLALLLINRNRAMMLDGLIDELWGDEAPTTAAKIVQNWVSQLRKTVDNGTDDPALVTTEHGYMLRARDDEVDAAAFEQLVVRARAASTPDETAALLRNALALWRGPALSDFAYERFARAEIERLEEERLEALEQRIEADLAAGRHAELVAEIDALVADHQFRERLRAAQMLALYRSGRQADALQAYHDARNALVEELGVEPGPELRALQRAILEHDASIAAPPRARRLASGAARTRRRAVIAAVSVGVVLVTAVVSLEGSSASRRVSLPVPANSLVRIDPAANRVAEVVRVGRTPISVALGPSSVWVVNLDDETVSQVDGHGRVTTTFSTGSTPTAVTTRAGSVWVATAGRGREPGDYSASQKDLIRLDPQSHLATAQLALPPGSGTGLRDPTGVISGGSSIWALNAGGAIARIDPTSNRVTATVADVRAKALAWGLGALWAITGDDQVVRVDPATARVTRTVRLPASGADGLAAGAGAVWVADTTDGKLWRIDGRDGKGRARAIDVGSGVNGVAVGRAAVWVANGLRGTILRVDPATGRVVASIPVGSTPSAIVADGDRVWAAVQGAGGPLSAAATTLRGRLQALPATSCGSLLTGGKPPDALIASDFPLKGVPWQRGLASSVAFVLREHGFRAGRFSVGYQACDDSTPLSGGSDAGKCTSDAKQLAADPSVIGVIGPLESSCAVAELPILNQAPNGPLALISPSNSNDALTQRDPLSYPPGAPGVLYPTGIRSYARVYPPDSFQARVDAAFAARTLDARRIFLIDDSEPYGQAMTANFAHAATRAGARIVGHVRWDPPHSRAIALAAAAAQRRPDLVFIGGVLGLGGNKIVTALRRRLGPAARLMAADAYGPIWALWDMTHGAAKGMYISYPGVPNGSLGPTGQRFVRSFRGSQPRGAVGLYAVATAAATEVLLDAIRRSNGTRAGVVAQLLKVRLRDSALGPLAFDRNGDTTRPAVMMMRVEARDGVSDVEEYEGGRVLAIMRR